MLAQADPSLPVDMWPDSGLAQRDYGQRTTGLPRVEYRDAGYIVALVDALNASRWDEHPLYTPGGKQIAGWCFVLAEKLTSLN